MDGLRSLARGHRRADLAAVGCLWALCLAFFARLVLPLGPLQLHVVAGDFTNQFYPFRAFAAAEWGAGRVPLWNPYVFAGHPFLADVQTAVFYPVSLANALLGALVGLPLHALELEMAAHYPLAALFTYLLGRQLLGSRLGAVVAAIAFTFGGFLTSYPAQQLAMLEAATWLPLVFLCLERAAAAPASGWRWHLAGGLAFGVCLLAGHPQTALFVGYASVGYLLYRTLTLRRAWRPALLGVALFALASAGLAGVQLLPTAEFLGLSNRASMPYEAAAHGFERRALLGILLPTWRGEKSLYVGILPLLLAAVGGVAALTAWPPLRRRRARALEPALGQGRSPLHPWREEGGEVRRPFPTPFFAALAALAVVLSLGGAGYLYRLFYLYAPGFGLFRDQERIIYLFGFAVALMAGLGARELAGPGAGKGTRAGRLRWGLPGLVALALVGAGALLYLGRVDPATFDPEGGLSGAVAYFVPALLTSAGVVYLGHRTERRRALAGALLAVLVADLFATNLGNNLGAADPDPGPRFAPIVAKLRTTPDEFRVRGQNDEAYPPNYAAVWQLPTTVGDTPFKLRRVEEFNAPDAEWRRWQVLNVRYFISPGVSYEGLELAFEANGLKVYRMMYPLPRAWAVRDVQVASGPDDALRRVLAPGYHPGDTVVLEGPPGLGPFVKGERPDVRVLSYSPQRVELAARGDGNAMLVLADTYYPGWTATLDGQPVALYQANFVVRAVELPPGEHRFTLRYDPLSFKLGALLTLATVAASAVAVGVGARQG